MKKKYRVILVLIIILTLMISAILLGSKFLKKEELSTTKVIDSIDNFGYTLDDRDTDLMKENYEALKELLKNDDVDMENYASLVAKLFIIDVFTIDNKLNKYDVGGAEYVWPDSKENFKLNIEDTLYKTVKVNNGERKQSLPIVSSINVDSVSADNFKIGDIEYPGYKINLSWEYEKNLGYDNKAEIMCVIKDKSVYVAKYSFTGE